MSERKLSSTRSLTFLEVTLERWRALRTAVPASFLAALMLGAGFLAFVAWDQVHWWRMKEDYGFGWLVPALVAFVIHDRWPEIVRALQACTREHSPRVKGWASVVLWTSVSTVLAFGVLLFLLGAFYRAGAGTSQPGTLAITLGAAAIILALLFIHAPEPVDGMAGRARWRDDPRLRLVGLFWFPVLVWLISAPIVSAIETQLSLALRHKVVSVVAFAFDLAGVPIEQLGNVLALPNGQVGIEDACSGIRSLTGCLFAGSFLAAVFLRAAWKKMLLIAVALLLAFVTNIGRSLFLTVWAYQHGSDAIGGVVHDGSGFAVLGVTVLGLLGLVGLIKDPAEAASMAAPALPAKA